MEYEYVVINKTKLLENVNQFVEITNSLVRNEGLPSVAIFFAALLKKNMDLIIKESTDLLPIVSDAFERGDENGRADYDVKDCYPISKEEYCEKLKLSI